MIKDKIKELIRPVSSDPYNIDLCNSSYNEAIGDVLKILEREGPTKRVLDNILNARFASELSPDELEFVVKYNERIRKETAKEIYALMVGEFECYIPQEIAKEIVGKYGVEVEE